MKETEKFIQYIQFEKRYSSHTILAYKSDISQFFIYLQKQYQVSDIQDITYLMIRSWLVDLMNEDDSARTVNRKLTALKSFYKFLLRQGSVKDNPMLKVLSPKMPKRLPVFVEKEKMDSLFTEIEFGEGFIAKRDRLILEIFYATGMRLIELVNLLQRNVDIHQSTFKVLGKRNKERIIPFGNKLKKLIADYLSEKEKVASSEYFFITEKGEKLYPKLVYRLVNFYLSKITTLSKKSPHVLRHTFATHMLNNGADLNAIKELLGHANLSATQVYTHNTIDKLKKVYKQAHPKA